MKLGLCICAILLGGILLWLLGSGQPVVDTGAPPTEQVPDTDVAPGVPPNSDPNQPTRPADQNQDVTASGCVRAKGLSPVEEATVYVFSDPSGGTGKPEKECTTDAEGRFGFSLPPGPWILQAAAHGTASVSKRVLVPCVIDFDLPAGVSVSGTVLNGPQREPLRHAEIEFRRLDLSELNPLGCRQVAATTADASGAFRMEGLTPGEHFVRVRTLGATWFDLPKRILIDESGTEGLVLLVPPLRVFRGLVLDDASGRPIQDARVSDDGDPAVSTTTNSQGVFGWRSSAGGPGGLLLDAVLRVEAPGHAGQLVNNLRRARPEEAPFTIRLVRVAATRGRVFSSDSAPLPNAVVLGMPAERRASVPTVRTISDSSGFFELDGLAGSCKLLVEAENHAGREVRATLPSDHLIEVTLGPCSAMRGNVTTEAEAPIEGAEVRLTLLDADGPLDSWECFPKEVLSDSRGEFLLDRVPAGHYTLRIVRSGFQVLRLPVSVRHGERLTLPTITLPEGAQVSGRVLHEGGEPVPGICVRVYPRHYDIDRGPDQRQLLCRTDASGHFSFAGLPEDKFNVAVSHQGVEAYVKDVRPGDSDVLLRLPDPCVLAGRVLDETGLPSPMFWLRLMTAGRMSRWSLVSSDAPGHFSTRIMKPGTYGIQAKDSLGHTSPLVTVDLESGTPVSDCLLRLAATTGSLRGVVLDAELEPRAGLSLGIRNLETGAMETVTTDGAGSFALDDLPGGRYELRIRQGRGPELRQTYLVAEQDTCFARVVLAPPGSLEVQVRRSDGTPVKGVRIRVRYPTGQEVNLLNSEMMRTFEKMTLSDQNLTAESFRDKVFRTNDDGDLRLPDLALGEYVIEATGEAQEVVSARSRISPDTEQVVRIVLSKQ